MPKEASNITQITDLNESYPLASDLISEADDHLRIIKRVLKKTFPNITDPMTPTSEQINKLTTVTASSTELNVLDGILTTTAQLNLLEGLTADATALNKLDGWAGDGEDLTYLKDLHDQSVSKEEFAYLDGVTSGIQSQLGGKVDNTVSVTANNGLTGGGALDANRTISHATGTLASGTQGNGSDNTKIDTITLDAYGHVTAVTTGSTGDIQNVSAASGTPLSTNKEGNIVTITHNNRPTTGGSTESAGSGKYVSGVKHDSTGHFIGITEGTFPAAVTYTASDGVRLDGNEFKHGTTSTATSVNNSGRFYIQDITLDKFGHVTGITSVEETAALTDTTYTNGAGIALNGNEFSCTVDTPGEVGLGNLSNNGNSVNGDFAVTGTGNITAAGDITAEGNINAKSDERLKENIEEIPDALAKLFSIRGVTFDRIDQPGLRQVGVIAQEVEEVLPEVVEDGPDGFKSVAYGNMVGLLIEAIKDQQKQIDVLKMLIVEGHADGTTN